MSRLKTPTTTQYRIWAAESSIPSEFQICREHCQRIPDSKDWLAEAEEGASEGEAALQWRAVAQTPWSAAPVQRLTLTPTPAHPRDPDLNHSAISMHSGWRLLCPTPCNLFLAHLFISQYSSFSCIFKLRLAAKFLLLMMLQCKARKGQPQLSAGQGLPSLLCLAFVARVALSAPWTRCQKKQPRNF